MDKDAEYAKVVASRKACHRCRGLTNPADVEGGRYDSEHIGPWSLWQGSLNASLMVVGQDWGDTGYFLRRQGREGPRNPTNLALVDLVGVAGVAIGPPGARDLESSAFFTNAILCLKDKEGGLQGKVRRDWFDNCTTFLRRQVEIVRPHVVVCLGQRAYGALLSAFAIPAGPFRAAVEDQRGVVLEHGVRAFAVYHCGARIRNTHRPMALQRADWERIRPFLAGRVRG